MRSLREETQDDPGRLASFETVLVSKVGERIPVALSASALYGPDGFYTLSVRVEDFSQNTAIRHVPVCVANGPTCPTKLVVKDCDDDLGAAPQRVYLPFLAHAAIHGHAAHSGMLT